MCRLEIVMCIEYSVEHHLHLHLQAARAWTGYWIHSKVPRPLVPARAGDSPSLSRRTVTRGLTQSQTALYPYLRVLLKVHRTLTAIISGSMATLPLLQNSHPLDPKSQATPRCANLAHFAHLTNLTLVLLKILGPIEGAAHTRCTTVNRRVRCSAHFEVCEWVVFDIDFVLRARTLGLHLDFPGLQHWSVRNWQGKAMRNVPDPTALVHRRSQVHGWRKREHLKIACSRMPASWLPSTQAAGGIRRASEQ